VKIFLFKNKESDVFCLVPGTNKEAAATLIDSCKPGGHIYCGESAEISETHPMPIGFIRARSGHCCLDKADLCLTALHA
jgi:hypothetical protein